MDNFVSSVAYKAQGRWSYILNQLGIDVPVGGKHGACPICGEGTDRFRFDDQEGRGTYFCNQCEHQAGDGLDLVARALNIEVKEAAELVAELLGEDSNRPSADVEGHQAHPKANAQSAPGKTKRAQQVWQNAEPAVAASNAYLVKKGILAYGLKVTSEKILYGGHTFTPGSLVLPCSTPEGELTAIQLIDTEAKRFMGATKGAFHTIGDATDDQDIFIVEGYATGVSIHEATGDAVIIALSSTNLLTVAQSIRERSPNSPIYLAADRDKNQTGERVARKAAEQVGGKVVLPPFPEGEYGDWNDYAAAHGVQVTKASLAAAKQTSSDSQETAATCANSAENPMELGLEGGMANKDTVTGPLPNDASVLQKEEVTMDQGTIQGCPLAYPEKDIARLQWLNKRYTHTTVGGKHVVVSNKPCAVNGYRLHVESLREFHNYFLHESLILVETSPGQVKAMSLGKAWLGWSDKSYCPRGLDFHPNPDQCPVGVYNLYTGLAVAPETGDCTPWLLHVRDVICAGDEHLAEYLIQWFAHLIQRPEEKPSVAIVLKGLEGTGKGALVRPLLIILGPYGIHVNGNGQITGRFNSTLDSKLLVFADEVDLTDRSTADRLKGIISEPTLNLERKGIDPQPIRNYARLIFASNHDKVINAGLRERRYLVLEPCQDVCQNKQYFDDLWQWVNNGGPAHLLHFLSTLELDGFDPRRCPITPALTQHKLESLVPVDQFIYERLLDGESAWHGSVILAADLVDGFMNWCDQSGITCSRPQAQSLIGGRMNRMEVVSSGRSGRGDGKRYEQLGITEMRRRFAAMLGSSPEELF